MPKRHPPAARPRAGAPRRACNGPAAGPLQHQEAASRNSMHIRKQCNALATHQRLHSSRMPAHLQHTAHSQHTAQRAGAPVYCLPHSSRSGPSCRHRLWGRAVTRATLCRPAATAIIAGQDIHIRGQSSTARGLCDPTRGPCSTHGGHVCGVSGCDHWRRWPDVL